MINLQSILNIHLEKRLHMTTDGFKRWHRFRILAHQIVDAVQHGLNVALAQIAVVVHVVQLEDPADLLIL